MLLRSYEGEGVWFSAESSQLLQAEQSISRRSKGIFSEARTRDMGPRVRGLHDQAGSKLTFFARRRRSMYADGAVRPYCHPGSYGDAPMRVFTTARASCLARETVGLVSLRPDPNASHGRPATRARSCRPPERGATSPGRSRTISPPTGNVPFQRRRRCSFPLRTLPGSLLIGDLLS
jgi:hypothetical protein